MINSVVIVGRLVADPELRKTNSGTSVASFRIACDDSRKGPNGEKTTVFMPVSAWGTQGDFVAKYFRKGNLIGVTGRLTQRSYVNKSNVNVTVTEIHADRVDFVESKNARGEAANDSGYASDSPAPAPSNQAAENEQDNSNTKGLDISDDDLPF